MRIRQRKVRLPLSYLSPIPLSDPLLSRSPVVQLQLSNNPSQNLFKEEDAAAHFDPQPSDRPGQPIAGESNTQLGCSHGGGDAAPHQEENKVALMVVREERVEDKINDTRQESALGAEILQQLSSSSLQALGSDWRDQGEKAFPSIKKRRVTFEKRSGEAGTTTTVAEKYNKKMKTKMKTKLGKNQYVQEEEDHDNEKEGDKQEANRELGDDHDIGSNATARMRGRGGALVEGSRCSRVNGRGWRCCQQTLVGYSLCEHHLGKGRLRSMSSVRSRSPLGKKDEVDPKPPIVPVSIRQPPSSMQEAKVVSLDDNGACEDDDNDQKKQLVAASKKKMKLGMVKARSISSLLGQQANGAIINAAECTTE
ncbi:hypothetical protein Tsubulata_035162 [Turnera subulata]|uniref:WRC domain-containing protein n=1 Tax=Turnera subulata TaxID=218843 RepID=A0A9Q0GG27_9ROSI|nr:hypothetical protein Tsubulata_035162 [Turnera subulata]